MSGRMFVLADADSFYASCERVFHPELARRPLVVLSNNDGCVVSRSREAKLLGISNGTPWFKIRGQAEHDGVVAMSSNYELYASLSRRMMRLMAATLPGQEIYSIDECFLRGFQDPQRTRIACTRMRETVLQGIGIPLTIATAPTRTLAKIVSHYIKHQGGGIGDWDLLRTQEPDVLDRIDVSEVWGVGRRPTRKLQGMSITTAGDLARADPSRIRHLFSVLLQRTVLELQGIPSIELDDFDAIDGTRKQQLMCSRMFGQSITGLPDLSAAVSTYAQQASIRLRKQGSLAGMKGKGRARQETGATWNMKRQHLSNRGTTRWDELAIAKAI